MARSNKELVDLALALGGELGVAVVTDGLKNDGLETLVAELEAKKAAAPGAAAPPGPVAEAPKPPFNGDNDANSSGGPPPPAAPAAPVLPEGTVSVAPGLSVICLRGHLDAGTVVTASDFGAGKVGEGNLADLLERGALVKS